MLFDIALQKKLPSFELNANLQSDAQRLAVLGASGSGKSLMLQLLAGLMAPDSGHIRINGKTWSDGKTALPPAKRKAGLLFQDYALFPHLTVAQNIGFALSRGWTNPRARPHHGETPQAEKIRRWLQKLQLEKVADHYPARISGGQKQRTALARTLIAEPDVLLLDEPFSALDTDLREHTRREVLALQQAAGVPMILITHDAADAEALAQEVWRMEQGVLRLACRAE